MGKKRILLVDYEPKLLERLESLLPQDRYDLATARDGFSALEEFDRFHPDMVFLRTMLPKKHGFQVCQEIVERSGSRPVPVVMHCSIYKSRKYRNDAIKVYGAAEYLEDPIDPDQLQDVLDRFLEKKTAGPAKPAVPSSGPEIEMPAVSQSSKPKVSLGMDIDKALEDTLSGLAMGTKRPKTPSVEATVPVGDLPKIEEAQPPQEPLETEEGGEITSEELFGDVIQDVIEEPKAPEAEPPAAAPPPPPPPPPPPAPETPPVQEPPAPKATTSKRERPTVDVEKALAGSLLGGPAPGDSSSVRRIKARSDQELSRKLEDTLGGVRLSPKETSKAEAPPHAPEPKAEEAAPAPPAQPPAGAERDEEAAGEKGVTFGNYILTDKIATGGMAELFRARQKGLEGFSRIVAIKRILPHLAANQDFVTMFIDEAKLAAQLNHPNIGHIYDLGKLEDSYFIAMEYVDGKDLRAILRELEERDRLMPTRVVVYVAQKVCDALHYAHIAKDMDGKPMDLVHRDVSPQNVIISTTGDVKLVDFGIAKAASKASHTVSGALKGKLLYMSPEQAWGKSIDRRTDIFSLGCVMCEMLTGQKLFYGDSEMSILERVREAKILPPREMRPDIPEELERILLKALSKNAADRYPDCRSMQRELERFAYDEWETPVSAYDAAAFLNEIFPGVYRKEILGTLKREPEREPVREGEAEGQASDASSKSSGRPPKSQRGRQAPGRKERESKAEAPSPKEPPKAEERAAPAPPPKPPAPPPPKAAEDSGSKMFGDVVEAPTPGGSRKLILWGGVAAAVLVVAVVLVIFLGGKKKPAEPAVPPPVETPVQKAEEAAKTPPPPVEEPKPAEPAPNTAAVSEAEMAAVRKTANDAMGKVDKSMTDLAQAGAEKYAGETFASLKKSQQNVAALLRRAKSKEEYQAVAQSADRIATQIPAVQTQIDQAKADEAAAAQKKAEEEAAAKKAQEEAAKKAQEEAAKKAEAAAKPKTKAGDMVELWAVDVRPRELKKMKVDYTPMARANRAEGTIYVEVTIDEKGNVTNARIVKGLTPDYGLNDACVKAALQTKYSPAIKDGVPVKTVLTYPVVFRIGT